MRRGRRHWPCPTCPRSEPQRSPNGRQRGEPGPPVTVGYLQPAPGLARPRRPGSADGRGSRPGASRTPRVGAAALAASGSRSWCRRRGGTAQPCGQLAHGGQVDAEQLGASLQRRRDRPAQVRVVPGPHRTSASNTSSRVDRERCVVRRGRSEPGWAVLGPQLGGTWGTPRDSRRQQT
jgi:hypothetical protein